MQLGRRSTPSTARNLAAALSETTATAGDRPAYTVLRRQRREEQGFRTFAQWVAKGAHLLQVDFSVEPGDRIHLDSPASWSAAAVACACWWVGASVASTADGTVLSVVHERRAGRAPSRGDVLWLGDSLDGGPDDPALASWSAEVVVFPDTPPPPRAEPHAAAWRDGATTLDQAALLQQSRELGRGTEQHGVVGLADADVAVADWIVPLARPLATGLATVIVDGADATSIEREPLDWWLSLRPGGHDHTARQP